MAAFVPPEDFAEVDAGGEQLLELGRTMAADGHTLYPADATPEQQALHQEATALSLAVMGLAHSSPLEPGAVLIALGHAVATIIAQAPEDHTELFRLLREQMRASYNDVVETSRPKGSC